jgi:hypothetical protein
MANGIDAMVDRVQLPPSQPAFNPPSTYTKRLKLSSTNNAVLLLREPSHPPVEGLARHIGVAAPICPPFSVPETVIGGRMRHGPRMPGRSARVTL